MIFNRIDIRDYEKIANYPHKPLTDDEIDLVENIFYSYFDQNIDEDILDENDNIFRLENFYPFFYGKECTDGAWIKVKTDIGYNVYYAKPSRKKISLDVITNKRKKMMSKKHKTDTLENLKKAGDDVGQALSLLKEEQLAKTLLSLPSDLYYVKIQLTKSKVKYLLPYEYEKVSDISLYTKAVCDKMNKNAVKYKLIYTKNNEDQIFYLQSRGIPKDEAIMMSNLQQCYFIVDVAALFREVIIKC